MVEEGRDGRERGEGEEREGREREGRRKGRDLKKVEHVHVSANMPVHDYRCKYCKIIIIIIHVHVHVYDITIVLTHSLTMILALY